MATTFTLARGIFGDRTPFTERVTIDRHRAPRVSSLTVAITDGERVLAERSATFHGLTCPLRIADVERALAECRADVTVFHRDDTDYAPTLMMPEPCEIVRLAQTLAH